MPATTPLKPWDALVRANLGRLSWHLLAYLVWSSLFLYGLEEASGLRAMQIGLLNTIVGCTLMAAPCMPIALLLWYAWVRPRWLRDPQLRARIERDGMYAALPAWQHLLLNLAVTLSWTQVGHQIWLWMLTRYGLWGKASPSFYGLANSLTIAGFATVVLYALDVIRVRQLCERARSEVTQRQLAQAQLQRLQAQLEPHMLFNTLANLHALIETQPARAQDMLAHLIDYLRATLGASRGGPFTLADEIRLVRDYLALMQIRMGTRLQVDIHLPDHLQHHAWPPMLLQPLVENAIRHGLDPLPEGGRLSVQVSTPGQRLQVAVQDNGVGLPATTPGPHSFGLGHVRERLHTTFGEDASLQLAPAQPRGTVVTLTLPLAST
jgi:signal transduction histidine kinase